MKKILLLVLTLFLSTTVLLAGCGDKGLKNNPNTNDPVTSNGGMAVLKGNYLYYVNGFKSYDGLVKDKDNVWGEQKLGAIYRVKVVNNQIAHDQNGFLAESECVVPQIVGTENASFYIFGDYIYYATPNMQKDKNGNLLNARSNICRVNINGTNNDVLYTTEQTLTASNWTINDVNGTVYIIISDGSKVISINANAKKPEATTLTSNATSVGLIKIDNNVNAISNALVDGINNYVYYTRNFVEADNLEGRSGNILARVKLGTTTEEVVTNNGNYTYQIKEAKNGCLYYNKTSVATSNTVLCKYALSKDKAFKQNNEVELASATYTTTIVLNSNNENYVGADVLTINESNQIALISVVNGNKNITNIYKGTETIKVLGLYGSKLFFLEGSTIKYVNVTDLAVEVKTVETNNKTIKTDVNTFFDYDGRNVYFYASYTPESGEGSNYYLNRTDLEAGTQKSEFVGVFMEGHTPAKPEADNDDDPENDPVWIS